VSAFRALGEIGPLAIWNGVRARAVEGREMTFAVVELDAHCAVALHQHPNEQIGIVLQGTLAFKIGDETRELRVGDTYEIPANVPHQATAGPLGAVVIDVFAPIRVDWNQFEEQPPQTPVWP